MYSSILFQHTKYKRKPSLKSETVTKGETSPSLLKEGVNKRYHVDRKTLEQSYL